MYRNNCIKDIIRKKMLWISKRKQAYQIIIAILVLVIVKILITNIYFLPMIMCPAFC